MQSAYDSLKLSCCTCCFAY